MSTPLPNRSMFGAGGQDLGFEFFFHHSSRPYPYPYAQVRVQVRVRVWVRVPSGGQNPDFFEIAPGVSGRSRGPAGGCRGLPGASGSFWGLPGASGADFRVRKSAGKNQIGAESPFLSATCGHINSPGSCGPPGPLDP